MKTHDGSLLWAGTADQIGQINNATVLVEQYTQTLEQLLATSPERSRLRIPKDIMTVIIAIEKRVKQLNFDGHQPKIDLPTIHHTKTWRKIMTFQEAFSQFDQTQEMHA